MSEMLCDGSGYLEYEEEGLFRQRPCPGCEACALQEPVSPPKGEQVIEVSMETLASLQAAYETVSGMSGALEMPMAWGLITSYLPALLEMARMVLLQEEEPVSRIRTSAHRVFTSGHDPV